MREQSRALEEIAELTGRVDQKARVAFRVFYGAGDHEVTVLTAR
jgi:hypothetical protein